MSAEIDVAATLAALRAEVRARRAALPAAEPTPTERELQRVLEELEYTRVVSAHWPLEGRNPLEQVVALINKVVRRYLRWYINPIVEQQNSFNDTAARAIRLLAAENAALRAELTALRNQIEQSSS
ncbi:MULTISPECIES: hypothetical protein [Chloroflexus]|jgi:hypothetical protein|uniref:Uncharacterized protein n=1 Tax=Chloroflexus aurantiacus (strain ATCC 29366 / DSM 635 / J-10-fl) TaxID=324602 RepID=A9WHU7_CHLAA|nr:MULTISPECIES: hypothetical protein [Chloroflexus]ABY34215.1 hypothetical protein Caur_0983 [Chloroflexus aurantiacus J-10-fl]RMG49162.1 MAG: hypothetical protein D6716_12065 [Chloroflexota bacterium]GIV93506.1 MAG: hypothetical protein KatS3mg056_2215 [Chloroflexus sp.]HBW66149.1 hypothetical protein [Chloroflexus aurantiacus]